MFVPFAHGPHLYCQCVPKYVLSVCFLSVSNSLGTLFQTSLPHSIRRQPLPSTLRWRSSSLEGPTFRSFPVQLTLVPSILDPHLCCQPIHRYALSVQLAIPTQHTHPLSDPPHPRFIAFPPPSAPRLRALPLLLGTHMSLVGRRRP